jgi:hypothetical protein
MNVTPMTSMTRSHTLTLDETLERLAASPLVDGLAPFGSRTVDAGDPVSDYDLLILVQDPPVRIFQMLTHIDGRIADVVFVETETVDHLLERDEAVESTSTEGRLMLKMRAAQIVHDASGRLERVREYTLQRIQSGHWLLPTPESDLYAAWFWKNHFLFHVKRMAQSRNPIYHTAADIMLLGGLSDLCRVYHNVRSLPWEGEKAALRYLQIHDPDYLKLLQACIAETDRLRKIRLCERLVTQTLALVGPLWTLGITSAYLRDAALHPGQVREALTFWESLLRG